MNLPLAYPFLLNQSATYWAPGGPDGFGGVLFSAPALIKCRWQNVQELFRRPDGEEHVSNAVVYPEVEVAEKGYVALGDHVGELNPKNLSGVAREVRQVSWSSSVGGDRRMIKVYV